jgi:hypothetical protein
MTKPDTRRGDPPSGPAKFMVKISASPELIDELHAVVMAHADSMTLKSLGPASEPAHMRLGLSETATLIAVINGVATMAQFAYSAYKFLSEKQSGGLTVQTPLRTVVITASDATSEERVRELLESALQI